MMSDRRQRFANEKHEYHDPTLLLGYWFDERARRETDFRESLDLFQKGELPAQKLEHYVQSLTKEVKCTESFDGRLMNGSIVGIAWGCSNLFISALPKSVKCNGQYEMPCLATGAPRPSVKGVPARSAIQIFRNDQRISDDVPLMHDECFNFCHVGSSRQLFLNYDSADPMPFRNVNWVEYPSGHTLWKTSGKDPYISIHSPVAIHHVASGGKIALDTKPTRSLVGIEHEILCSPGNHFETWRFEAPCQQFLNCSERRHLLHRNVWDVLNQRY